MYNSFWRSLEVPLINCKVELKLKWMRRCVLAAGSVDNTNADRNIFIFTIKNTKLYVPVVTLSASVFLNIKRNFVIMIYSASTETKQTILSHF